jgi:DNA polymerase-4
LELTASVGIAPLKFVAKIASDLDKPDGFTEVGKAEILSFLDPLPVARLWGVGRVGNEKLAALQLKTIGDIRRYDRVVMNEKFGNWGDHLWKLANGIDPRKVISDRNAKQISHERTFQEDMVDGDAMRSVVSHLCEQVSRRLRRNERFSRSVSLKYRCGDFRTYAQTRSFAEPTQSTDSIFRLAMVLLEELVAKHPEPVRLLGVSVGNLTGQDTRQLQLFDSEGGAHTQKAIDKVVDQLTEQIGSNSVYRATSHSWINRDDK